MKSLKKDITTYKEHKDRSLLFLTLSVLFLFIDAGICIGLYNYTLISLFSFSKLFVAFSVVGLFIPLKHYLKWFHFIKYEAIIFNIIGVGPFLSSLFLCINFFFSSNANSETYTIKKIYYDGSSIALILEKNAFSGEKKITELSDIDLSELANKRHLKLKIAQGIFGYDVIKEKEIIQ